LTTWIELENITFQRRFLKMLHGGEMSSNSNDKVGWCSCTLKMMLLICKFYEAVCYLVFYSLFFLYFLADRSKYSCLFDLKQLKAVISLR
jgi:hypothetical protein